LFRKNVAIRFKSIITDLSLPGLVKVGEMLCDPMAKNDESKKNEIETKLSACEREIYENISGAELSSDGTQMSLVYEDDLGAEGRCINMVNFDIEKPNCIRIVRDGTISSSMTFDAASPFSRCSYSASGIPFEFGIYTRAVKNSLSEKGGSLIIDYVLDIRGHKVQRCQTFIKINTEIEA
jgi:uncharacterized beta-barrel protein YwiB (DUF1934 family)